jgi:Pentapeptide repeats (8 copies)
MADAGMEELLRRGVDVWNAERPVGWVSLADLDLYDMDLRGADLSHAGMWGCSMSGSDLTDANLDGADLEWATLCRVRLIRTSVEGATFSNAWVYGAAIWDLRGTPKAEDNLSIVPEDKYSEQSDRKLLRLHSGGLRMAQFLSSAYSSLLSDRPDALMSGMVDALSARIALLLGRFKKDVSVLDDVASVLGRSFSIVPLVFDFDKPESRDLTETVGLWARLCSIIIVDLTNPASVPHELATVVPSLPSVPVYPIIRAGEEPYSMFEHLLRYPWVRELKSYGDNADLEAIVAQIVDDARLTKNNQ